MLCLWIRHVPAVIKVYVLRYQTESIKNRIYLLWTGNTGRDLEYLTKHGYDVRKIQPVDMFSFTDHCENICLLTKNLRNRRKIKTNTNTKRI